MLSLHFGEFNKAVGTVQIERYNVLGLLMSLGNFRQFLGNGFSILQTIVYFITMNNSESAESVLVNNIMSFPKVSGIVH